MWNVFRALISKNRGESRGRTEDSADDPYEILGLDKTAGADAVKSAYREKIKEYHPDKFQNQPEWVKKQAEEMTQKINRAYEALKR